MNSVKIKKAKIKDSLFLEVEYTEDLPGHSKKDTKLTCTVPVHADLIESFAKLPRHLYILCDQLKDNGDTIFSYEEVEKYDVSGFTITGNDESEGCALSGSKKVDYGVVNLNSPIQKFSTSEYPLINDLSTDIAACIFEVEQYLFEGKKAPEQQLDLQFGDEADETVTPIAKKEKKKKSAKVLQIANDDVSESEIIDVEFQN